MKVFLFFIILYSFSSFAASVKITSFNYVRSGQYYAELCGKVEEMTSFPTFIRIIVDPKAKNPGVYNTIAGEDGKFCHVVVTYQGQAEANIFGSNERIATSLR